jgi:hypothetical protein
MRAIQSYKRIIWVVTRLRDQDELPVLVPFKMCGVCYGFGAPLFIFVHIHCAGYLSERWFKDSEAHLRGSCAAADVAKLWALGFSYPNWDTVKVMADRL